MENKIDNLLRLLIELKYEKINKLFSGSSHYTEFRILPSLEKFLVKLKKNIAKLCLLKLCDLWHHRIKAVTELRRRQEKKTKRKKIVSEFWNFFLIPLRSLAFIPWPVWLVIFPLQSSTSRISHKFLIFSKCWLTFVFDRRPIARRRRRLDGGKVKFKNSQTLSKPLMLLSSLGAPSLLIMNFTHFNFVLPFIGIRCRRLVFEVSVALQRLRITSHYANERITDTIADNDLKLTRS